MTCENGHLHPPPDFADGPGRAEAREGGASAGMSETQPLDSIFLYPSFSSCTTGGRIEDFFRALSSSKFCDSELRVVAFTKLFLFCYQ